MDDYEKANTDINECIDSITSIYPVDISSIYIGGYSGGAIASVNFALSGIAPIKGVVALCPEVKPPAFTDENVRKAVKRGLRCVFMEGENVLPVNDEDEMRRTFDEEGLAYEYYINKEAGHDLPSDFDKKLGQALTFISGRPEV